jgi:hypothetical protein
MHLFILYSSCKIIVLAFVLEKRARKQREGMGEVPALIILSTEANS